MCCGGISSTSVHDEKIKSLVAAALTQISSENEPHEYDLYYFC